MGLASFQVGFEGRECLPCDVVDKKLTDDAIRDGSERRDAEIHHVDNPDEGAIRGVLKFPDHAHALGESAEVEKVDFQVFAVDRLLGRPCDGDACAVGCHFNDVSIGAAFDVGDVSVMRKHGGPA